MVPICTSQVVQKSTHICRLNKGEFSHTCGKSRFVWEPCLLGGEEEEGWHICSAGTQKSTQKSNEAQKSTKKSKFTQKKH